jgi:hypothetical protein
MKKLFGWALLLLILVSATAPTSPDPMHSLQGTWELQSFYNYEDQNISDTVPVAEGYRQVKMYYDGKVMWARIDPRAPIGRFGYGTYEITDTELIETIEFGDAEFMKALDTMRIFRFDLIIKDNTYSQVSIDENGVPFFSENYLRVK